MEHRAASVALAQSTGTASFRVARRRSHGWPGAHDAIVGYGSLLRYLTACAAKLSCPLLPRRAPPARFPSCLLPTALALTSVRRWPRIDLEALERLSRFDFERLFRGAPSRRSVGSFTPGGWSSGCGPCLPSAAPAPASACGAGASSLLTVPTPVLGRAGRR